MEKGERTKALIMKTAAALFAQKGYAAVTMQDICDASGLSRGGLYRHFGSTKAICIAMLSRDVATGKAAVDAAISAHTPAMHIFNHFLAFEREAMLGEQRGLYYAIHEFAFHEPDTRELFCDRLDATLAIIKAILCYGQEQGAFMRFDTEAVANHIVYFLDALKTSSIIFSLTEDFIDKQFDILRSMLQ
ncbi:MAG: TetR/AcrR family transcriptional regulator [Oscillospiraceae bacterium]|jgi:AcrR family transcriptional regulator|nr:TetR/AcrR family transcriptional regulator [Oscillospiraceae bacterium]